MPKKKVFSVIDQKVADEIDDYYKELVTKALKERRKIPKISNVYEELINKGWDSVQRERK